MPEQREAEIYKKYSDFKRYLLELGWCKLPHEIKFDALQCPVIECKDKTYHFTREGKLLKVSLKKIENPRELYKIFGVNDLQVQTQINARIKV